MSVHPTAPPTQRYWGARATYRYGRFPGARISHGPRLSESRGCNIVASVVLDQEYPPNGCFLMPPKGDCGNEVSEDVPSSKDYTAVAELREPRLRL